MEKKNKLNPKNIAKSDCLKDIRISQCVMVSPDALTLAVDGTCTLNPFAKVMDYPIAEPMLVVKHTVDGFVIGLQHANYHKWDATPKKHPSPGEIIPIPVVEVHEELYQDPPRWGV